MPQKKKHGIQRPMLSFSLGVVLQVHDEYDSVSYDENLYGVQRFVRWWRRRELNPRPKTHPFEPLRAQTVILASAVFLGHGQAVTRRDFGSFIVHGAGKAYRAHVLHSSTPHPRSWTSGVERSLLRQRQEQRNRCSLIYKMPVLWMSGASARYSNFRVPVETGTPPRRRKSRFTSPRGRRRGRLPQGSGAGSAPPLQTRPALLGSRLG